MRSLVISAGGSKGAWASGLVTSLIEKGFEWDYYCGSSTGALLTPLVAAGDLNAIRNGYTNITSKDIFTQNPFRVNSVDNGNFDYRINHIGIIRNFLSGNFKTLGDSSKLRSLIRRTFTEEHFVSIQEKNRVCIIGVTDITNDRPKFISSSECDYEDFCDWMWISTCAPPFMSIVTKDGTEYADGGLTCPIPLNPMLKLSPETIDMIVLSPEKRDAAREPIRNVLHYLQLTASTMLAANMRDELEPGNIRGQMKKGDKITLRTWQTPRELTNNPLIFDPQLMKEWWEEGHSYDTYTEQRFTYKKNGKKETLRLDI